MSIIPDSPVHQKPKGKVSKPRVNNLKMNKTAPKEAKEITQISQPKSDYFYGVIPDEINKNAKGGLLKIASMPARGKSDIMFLKLQNSMFLNQYLNKYMHMDVIAGLNDHLKAIATYSVLYLESMTFTYANPEETAKLNEKKNVKINNEV